LEYTLVSDGPSDQVLLPVLDWLLDENSSESFSPHWADLRRLPNPPRNLRDRIKVGVELYPCDLLFVHRDAERFPRENRIVEIRSSLVADTPAVCVIPVKMQEAWFLFDTKAIRSAAGNPRGRHDLDLPRMKTVESVPDPKRVLYTALKTASGLSGRRRRDFPTSERAHHLANLIEDFSPLRSLAAFAALETELQAVLLENGWR